MSISICEDGVLLLGCEIWESGDCSFLRAVAEMEVCMRYV